MGRVLKKPEKYCLPAIRQTANKNSLYGNQIKTTATILQRWLGEICVTKTKQLENEINQKAHELNVSLNIQHVLHEKLKSNTKALEEIENLLKIIEANLRYSNDYVYTLEQENKNLKSSCDAWMKRAISLEFEVLSARAETGK